MARYNDCEIYAEQDGRRGWHVVAIARTYKAKGELALAQQVFMHYVWTSKEQAERLAKIMQKKLAEEKATYFHNSEFWFSMDQRIWNNNAGERTKPVFVSAHWRAKWGSQT